MQKVEKNLNCWQRFPNEDKIIICSFAHSLNNCFDNNKKNFDLQFSKMLEKLKQRMFAFICFILIFSVGKCQQFLEDFENYCVGDVTNSTRFNYSGTWYRQDTLNFTKEIKVKKNIEKNTTCYLAVFQSNTSSVNCRNITLALGNVYTLQFDHTWEFAQDSELYVSWNGVQVLRHSYINNPELVLIHENITLPKTNDTNNILCFSGSSLLFSLTALGPCVDNINITIGSNQLLNSTQNLTGELISQQRREQNSILSNQFVFVQIFSIVFNQFSSAVSIFGFSYLISNLLNFWNIMVLYYFLNLSTFIPIYRLDLLQLCQISQQQGSIYDLIRRSVNKEDLTTTERYTEIPSQWPWFNELGFTSEINFTNTETYFNLLNCILKIFSLKIIFKLIKKKKCCLSKIVSGFNVPFLDILCYEILCSSPGVLIPYGAMVSGYSNLGFRNLKEKLNYILHVIFVIIFIGCLLIPLLTKKIRNLSVKLARINQVKNSSKNVEQPKPGQQNAIQTCKPKKSSPPSKTFPKDSHYKIFIFWQTVIEIQNCFLFFSVSLLIGLQNLPAFFLLNALVLIFVIAVEWKCRKIITQFKKTEFWLGIIIKLVFLVIHVLFITVFLHQKGLIQLDTLSMGWVNQISILLIIIGAIIEIFNTCLLFIMWAFQIVKKIKEIFMQKLRITDNFESKQHKKTRIRIQTYKDSQVLSSQSKPPQKKMQKSGILGSKRQIMLKKRISRKAQKSIKILKQEAQKKISKA